MTLSSFIYFFVSKPSGKTHRLSGELPIQTPATACHMSLQPFTSELYLKDIPHSFLSSQFSLLLKNTTQISPYTE